MPDLDLAAVEALQADATGRVPLPVMTRDALVARMRHLEKLLEYPVDSQGRKLFCPRCGGPDTEGYPREVLDA